MSVRAMSVMAVVLCGAAACREPLPIDAAEETIEEHAGDARALAEDDRRVAEIARLQEDLERVARTERAHLDAYASSSAYRAGWIAVECTSRRDGVWLSEALDRFFGLSAFSVVAGLGPERHAREEWLMVVERERMALEVATALDRRRSQAGGVVILLEAWERVATVAEPVARLAWERHAHLLAAANAYGPMSTELRRREVAANATRQSAQQAAFHAVRPAIAAIRAQTGQSARCPRPREGSP